MTEGIESKTLVVIFAYASAGLGHLRVTDALYHGLPSGITPILLKAHDKSVSLLHRLTSIHPLGREIGEFMQYGLAEKVVAFFYSVFLKSRSEILYQQITTILDQRIVYPETVLVVATHFGLAHQLARIKLRLQKETGVKFILVVQVTDDSPQLFWYVEGADMIFVPSRRTKHELLKHTPIGSPGVHIETLPYPISPVLGQGFRSFELDNKKQQLSASSNVSIHLSLPVSGAAVGLGFLKGIVRELHSQTAKFKFHIVSRESNHTPQFLSSYQSKSHTQILSAGHDRQVVDLYEQLYLNEVIALEITKPSEQSFKALFSPSQRGGAILLFTQTIGRQEQDNLRFLKKHKLIPSDKIQESLWQLALSSNLPTQSLLKKARSWRGVRLPENYSKSSQFILWCLRFGIFENMMEYHPPKFHKSNTAYEVRSDGVELFWEKVAKLI